MAVYKAPLKDINFVLNEVLDVSSLAKLPGYEDATPDTIQAILEEAASSARSAVPAQPQRRRGRLHLRERRGAHAQGLQGGLREVRRRRLAGADLRSRVRRPGPAGDGEHRAAGDAQRGQPGLGDVSRPVARRLRGAARARHATSRRRRYLPKLADGRWTGTMCLTEPHCGTDLGLLRTKAEPQADGTLHDHRHQDLHLRRRARPRREHRPPGARAPAGRAAAAPRASRCSSCRSSCSSEDGTLGERNGICCGAIEHKMGIKANATCVHELRRRQGLAGRRAEQGPAGDVRDDERRAPRRRHAGRSASPRSRYQNALAYAQERLQGRSLTGPKNADKPADPDHRAPRRAAHAADRRSRSPKAPARWRCGSAC